MNNKYLLQTILNNIIIGRVVARVAQVINDRTSLGTLSLCPALCGRSL